MRANPISTNKFKPIAEFNNNRKIALKMGFKSPDEASVKKVYVDKSAGRFELLSEFGHLEKKERTKVFDRFNYPLSGYTNDKGELKVSIWGKILGYNESFSVPKIRELKEFISESKMLGAGFETSLFQGQKEAYSVDEFARIYEPGRLASLVSKELLVNLLDSDKRG